MIGRTYSHIVLGLFFLVASVWIDWPGTGSQALAAKADRIPVASAARLGGDGRKTRFVVDLSKALRFNAYVLHDPYRVIVDLEEVNFQLPQGLGTTGRGLVEAYRYGLFGPGRSRIVMDANAPIIIEKAFMLESRDGFPARLVIDVTRVDPAEAQRNAGLKHSDPSGPLKSQKTAKLTGDETLGVKPKARPKPPSPSKKRARPVIVIDPGHGGVDPGASGRKGAAEKTIVFKFAKELSRKLRASGKFSVHMTRNKDTFVRLRDRVRYARERDADLFISIHADAIRRGDARGATIYTLSEKASDKEAEALARKENRSDIIAGIDLGDANDEVTGILIDLAQRETKNHSVDFAKHVVKSLSRVTRMNKRPHRFAGFRVLKAPDVPSVLLELGYLTNRTDEKLLTSSKWRAKTAQAMVTAIGRYFAARLAHGG